MKGLLAQFPGRRSSWAVIGGWILLLVVFAPFGSKIPDVTNDEYVLPGGSQTAQLHQILRDRFPGGDLRPALIVYRHEGGLTDADKTEIMAEARARWRGSKRSPSQPVAPFPQQPLTANLVSANGEVALTIVPIEAGKIFHVIPTIDAIRDELPTEGPLEAHVTGFPGITADYNGAIKDADFKLLGATVVLVLFLLILVYRSPVLALVPLIVVGVAYMVTTGIIYLLNQRDRPGGGQLVDLAAPCADVRRGHGLLPPARVAVRRAAAADGVCAGSPATGDPRSGAADGGERPDRDRGAADDTRRGLRRLPHLRARDGDRDRRRPALRSHACCPRSSASSGAAPTGRAPRRLLRGASKPSAAAPDGARSPSAFAGGRRPTSASPSPFSSSAPRDFCSGRPTSTRSGSSGRRTTRARATRS